MTNIGLTMSLQIAGSNGANILHMLVFRVSKNDVCTLCVKSFLTLWMACLKIEMMKIKKYRLLFTARGIV
jgi:hypothetical protein